MTKRYFYDCPLKAAYMAKHHGMQLVCCYQAEDDGLEYASDDSYPFSDAGIDAEMWGDIVKAECRRVYIHPDSLALLEPEGTDLCKVAYDGDFGRSEAVENWGYSLLSGRRPGLRLINPSCDLLTAMEDFRQSAGRLPTYPCPRRPPWTTTSWRSIVSVTTS
jgi:hypothetical protein